MPKQHITLVDIHARNQAIGPLLEETADAAPEFDILPVRRINGTTYKQRVRTSRQGATFVDPGSGALVTASQYDVAEFECKTLEGQLEVYQSIALEEAKAQGVEVADILTDEAVAFMAETRLNVGAEVFYGKKNAANIVGLDKLVNSAMEINATGTGGSTASAWFIRLDPKNGVHFIMPNGHEMDLTEWLLQQIILAGSASGGDLKKTNAYVSGLVGKLGMGVHLPAKTIGRVKNITEAKPLTDALAAKLVAKFKRMYRPTHVFTNPQVGYYLQNSRTAMGYIQDRGSGEAYAPLPRAVAGLPIIYTDSLNLAESAS